MKKRVIFFTSFLLIGYGWILLLNDGYDSNNRRQEPKSKIELPSVTTLNERRKENSNIESKTSNIVFYLSIDPIFQRVPIVQSKDNSYYLNHSIDHRIDPIGTPFLDYRNNWNDKKLLVYGHNSKVVETTFHLLEKYLDPDFYKMHPQIIMERESTKLIYQIFSVLIVKNEYQHMRLHLNQEEYKNHLAWLKKNSIYNIPIELNYKEKILILQTCYYKPEDSYLLIAAKRI